MTQHVGMLNMMGSSGNLYELVVFRHAAAGDALA